MPSIVPRAVFDTGTLVGAALRLGSVPHRALTKALGGWVLCAGAETLAELDRVLQRDKFDRFMDRESRLSFAAPIRRHARLFPVSDAEMAAVDPSCRDPKDQSFLALALAAGAVAIVSSDEDLLVLDTGRGIAIVTPAAFLDRS